MNPFDEQLARSSPPVPVRESILDAELDRIITRAQRAAAHPRSRRRRVVVAGLFALGALGAGGAAAAVVVPWFDDAPARGVVTTSTGDRCALTFGAKPVDDPGAPVEAAVQAEAVAAAEEFLEDLDVSALEMEEREVGSVYQAVGERLDAELARQGLPSSSVGLSMLSDCDSDDR